jgi:hypothetical protein
MSSEPVICFGQQPSGFFPKRFLVAKINTARALQKEIGGKIVFFYHDSDADYRETITLMKDLFTGADVRLNFTQENKLQKKHSPLYLKRIPAGWKEETLKQLPRFAGRELINTFKSVDSKFVADFCLEMYKKMGLLEGIGMVRSSDKSFRQSAMDIAEGFADVEYQGEIVRAKMGTDNLSLHEGGAVYTYLPKSDIISKEQISAGKDERFGWMNSVIRCTHYIFGEGEKNYLKTLDFPEVKFIEREQITDPDYAWLG